MPKSNKRPLYHVGRGRPFVPVAGKRVQVWLAPKTGAMLRKMAEASGLPSGLIVHAALGAFQRLTPKVQTARALRLIGVG